MRKDAGVIAAAQVDPSSPPAPCTAGRKIRVLHLVNSWAQGGAETIVAMLAMNLDRERFAVVPCALVPGGPVEEQLRAAGIACRAVGIPYRSILTGPFFVANVGRMLAALTNILRELSVDIVHVHLHPSIFLGILAARRAGVPRVCATIHNVVFHRRHRLSPRRWMMDAVTKRLFPRVDRIIGVCEEVSRVARARFNVPDERVLTIPNGVDADGYRLGQDRGAARRKVGLPPGRCIVVTVGRLTAQKGYPHLLAALALIPSEMRPLTLFVGDGPDRPELESMASHLGLADDTRFLGNRTDVADLLASADVFVLSSLWEGLPLALLEAAAAALPAVVTAVGGNVEVVENGQSGLLAPPGDERALADAICSLLRDPERRVHMGRAARERFERRYSLNSFVRAHERLYETLVADLRTRAM